MLHLVRLSIQKFRGFTTKGHRSIVCPRVRGHFSRAMIYTAIRADAAWYGSVRSSMCAGDCRTRDASRHSRACRSAFTSVALVAGSSWIVALARDLEIDFPCPGPRHCPFLRLFHYLFRLVFFIKCKYIDEIATIRMEKRGAYKWQWLSKTMAVLTSRRVNFILTEQTFFCRTLQRNICFGKIAFWWKDGM